MKIRDLVSYLQTLPQEEVMYLSDLGFNQAPLTRKDIVYGEIVFGGNAYLGVSPWKEKHWQIVGYW